MDFKKITDAFKVSGAIDSGRINANDMVNIVHTANNFQSSIVLHADNKTIDVKSFLGLSVSLLTPSQYKLEVHGNDEELAKDEMKKAFGKYGIKVEII